MVTVPLPDAELMTFAEFINWKPDNRRYELHHGTPTEMQPTGDHEEVISLYQLVDDEYQVSQFRGDEPIQSALFPELSLTAATIFLAGQ